MLMNRLSAWWPWVVGVIVISGGLAALDRQGAFLLAWLSYLALCSLGALLIVLVWKWVGAFEGPRSLVTVLGIALALRLCLGIGLTYALPIYGYDEEPQRAGYVFYDAYHRDKDAWALSESSQPLWSAMTDQGSSDQYGGMMFLSAAVYRFISPDLHRQLLIVTISAAIASLSVLFTWAFTNLTFGSRAAIIAAWIVALYPDAVLLGASQMREPFMMTALAMSFYGYGLTRKGEMRAGGAAFLAGLAIMLFISPPYAVILLGVLGLAWIWEGQSGQKRTAWVLGVIAVLGLLALGLTIRAWSNIGDGGSGMALLNHWLVDDAKYQLHLIEKGSGWVQKLFQESPEWMHMPMATIYGLVQPFFPAGLIVTGAPIWHILVAWRGLGWFILLPLMVYAPFAALKRAGFRSMPAYLSFLVWAIAILVSYRAAGDLWDNPRYRTVFITAQAALAGWAWVHARRQHSPWLRRTAIVIGFATLLFITWYAGRYHYIPRINLWETLGSIGIFTVVYVAGCVVWDKIHSSRERRLTENE